MAAILISSIIVPKGRRKLDPDWVRTIADSYLEEGQLSEIEVVGTEQASTLIYGGHRLAAAIVVGWNVIDAVVRTVDEVATEARRKQREIAENLIRRKLSVLDKAADIAAWRDIYEAAHGAVRRGRPSKLGQVDPISDAATDRFTESFSEAACRALSVDRNAVKRALRIAAIVPSARERLALHPIADVQSELLQLAAEPAPRQERISRMLAGEAEIGADTVAEAIALIDRLPKPTVAPAWQKVADRFATLKEADQDRFFALHEAAILRWQRGRPT